MKIALVRQQYRPDGGAEQFVTRALQGLSDANIDMTVITRQWQSEGAFHAVNLDPHYWGRKSKNASFEKAVVTYLKQYKQNFDLVQSHERIPGADIYRAGDGVHAEWLAQKAKRSSKARNWATRISSFHRYMLEAEERVFRDRSLKKIICISQLVKRNIQTHFDLPDEKLQVIYNGIDLERFAPCDASHRQVLRQQLGLAQDVPTVLFVGSGFERKGLQELIHALSVVPDVQLVVVGRDKKQHAFQSLADNLGLGKRIIFAGVQKNVVPYYQAADVLAHPAWYEPFGNVVLEAVACGLPVIVTEQCGAADLVREAENGWIVSQQEALVTAIKYVSQNDLACMRKAARSCAQSYSLAQTSSDLVTLYRSIL